MKTDDWYRFFNLAIDILGEGGTIIDKSNSWCSWTTFQRLECWDAGYWRAGLPKKSDIEHWGIADGSVWGQPFNFNDIAHLIIPNSFCTDSGMIKIQNTQKLKDEMGNLREYIKLGKYVLEIKLY